MVASISSQFDDLLSELDTIAAAQELTYKFLDKTVAVHTVNGEQSQFLETYLQPYFSNVPKRLKPDIRITVDDNVPDWVQTLWDRGEKSTETWFFGASVPCIHFNDWKIVRCPEVNCIIISQRHIIIWGLKSAPKDLLFLARLVREASLNRLEVPFLRVHGGIVDVRGSGILAIGDSGAGKTSFLIKLLKETAGRFCANDRVLLAKTGVELMAYGTPIQSQVGERHLPSGVIKQLHQSDIFQENGEIGFFSKTSPFLKASLSPRFFSGLFNVDLVASTTVRVVVVPRFSDDAGVPVSVDTITIEKRASILQGQLLNTDPAFPMSVFYSRCRPEPEELKSALVNLPWVCVSGNFSDPLFAQNVYALLEKHSGGCRC